jgi:hypothetical protein
MAGCLAFTAVSPPLQFMPWMIAAARKHAERRIVSRVEGELAQWPVAWGAMTDAAESDRRPGLAPVRRRSGRPEPARRTTQAQEYESPPA